MPHRIHLERRVDQLAIAAIVLSTCALVVAVVFAITTTRNQSQIRSNGDRSEAAICATIEYADRQAVNARAGDPTRTPPRPPNPEAADELETLAADMRAAGVDCPKQRPSAEPPG